MEYVCKACCKICSTLAHSDSIVRGQAKNNLHIYVIGNNFVKCCLSSQLYSYVLEYEKSILSDDHIIVDISNTCSSPDVYIFTHSGT